MLLFVIFGMLLHSYISIVLLCTYYCASSYYHFLGMSFAHMLLIVSIREPAKHWTALQSTVSLPLPTFPCYPLPVHYWPGRILESLQSTDSLPLFTSPFPVPSATSALLAWLDIRKPAEH